MLITPQAAVAIRALDRIGEALREQGVTLEELIESGCAGRDALLQELYGIGDSNDDIDDTEERLEPQPSSLPEVE